MRKVLCLVVVLCLSSLTFAQSIEQKFSNSDVVNFWTAYDKIISTKDTLKQTEFLRTLYINKASAGLKAMIEVRNYSEQEFLNWILNYPNFWNSIRSNTLKVSENYVSINNDLQKVKGLYTTYRPADIYFMIGAFRSGGTIQGNKILIGAELSLADEFTNTDGFPTWRIPFYKNQKPKEELALLCAHEFIHTQQNKSVENLLSMCLYEGVAEFVSCKATGKNSTTPAIAYGKANEAKVVDKFVQDLFLMSNDYNWLYGENRNEFKIRDLGYYIGYEICERYYQQSTDKNKAIKELIELDYTNEAEVERIVNSSKLLPKGLEDLYKEYEQLRPRVIKLSPFENGTKNVKPGLTKITIHFSEPILKYNTGIDFGPLGKDHFPVIKAERMFSEDGRTWTFEADLKANQHYQILISNNFRLENGTRLKPYLIDFETSLK
jgi:Predicted Zn-dependent protease (DUF2268)/Bacterial Ig-like domain